MQLARARTPRRPVRARRAPGSHRRRVITIANNKGGIGKTTVANNLAVYMRALEPELPILVVGLDDQPTPDRMFSLDCESRSQDIATGLRRGSLDASIQLGQYGVHYVPSSPEIGELKREIRDPFHLEKTLERTDWPGLVLVDTKSDFEILTQNAVAASDLTVVAVTDQASLTQAQKVYDLVRRLDRAPDRAQVLLNLIDRRIKYRGSETRDMLGLLISEIRRRGYPLLENFISRSPRVEALATNPHGRALSILHQARDSLVHRQMRMLAEDLLTKLEDESPQSRAELLREMRGGAPPEELALETEREAPLETPDLAPDIVTLLRPLTTEAGLALGHSALHITRFPLRIGRLEPNAGNDLGIHDHPPYQVSRRHAQLFRSGERIGVIDLGSHLGTWVDGKQLGGSTGNPGPVYFTGSGGRLVLGKKRSRYCFDVVISSATRH